MATVGRIIAEVHDGVARLTISNPERANALSPGMLQALEQEWRRLDEDRAVRVVLFTAVGDRHFCAGADVQSLSQPGEIIDPTRPARWTSRQNQVGKPVVVAVNGVCAGGGLGFVTDADVVVASRNARFLDPHVEIGQVSGFSVLRLALLVGTSEATLLALGGRAMGAERAYALGLVSELHDTPDEARGAAAEIAGNIARASPAAVAATIRGLREIRTPPHEAGVLQRAMAAATAHWTHPDAAEGPRARLEKRAPVWSS